MTAFLSFILVASTSFSATPSAKTAVIGLASNFSEVSSSSSNPFGGYFRNGVTLALEQNQKRLASRKIKIVTRDFDYGTSDAQVLTAAKTAAASEVIGVLGYNFSSHALLAAPIHQEAHLPMLSPSATANRIGRLGPFVHQGCFDNAFMGETLARVAKERLRAKRAAIVVAADCAYCTDLADAFAGDFKRLGGSVVESISVLQSESDFSSVGKRLKASNFDVVVVPNQELSSARIISAVKDAGVEKPFLGGDGWGNVGEEFFGILGDRDVTGYSVSHWHRGETSARSLKFLKEYRGRFKQEPNDTSVLAYDSMMLMIDAILRADGLTRAGLEKALSGTKDFEGVTGHFLFQEGRAPSKSLVLIEAKKAKFKVVGRIEPVSEAKR